MTRPIRCLITAGPTREYFDPVRFMSNPSTGKMGYALAQAAIDAAWTVDLISGPVSIPPPQGANLYSITTGAELQQTCHELFPTCDILIMCAAVCDMRPAQTHPHKVKKESFEWNIRFEPVPDILKGLSAVRKPGQVMVGFAAETWDIAEYARRKLKEKNLDWIVANDVSRTDAGFGADTNTVTLYARTGETYALQPGTKLEVASSLLALFAPSLCQSRTSS